MSARMRLAAALLALLLPGLVLLRWTTTLGALQVREPVLSLPHQVGPWVAVDEERLEAEVFALIEPDAYTFRRYEAPGRSPVWIYAGLYLGRASYGKAAHDPHVCYPAQGWEILDSRPLDVAVGVESSLRVTRVLVHKDTYEQSVLYWFQPAARWPVGAVFEQAMRVVDAIAGRPQYVFVRLSGPAGEPDEEVADLAEFAAAIAPTIRDRVTSARVDPKRGESAPSASGM